MGLIGHELRTPLATSYGAAEHAVYAAREVLLDVYGPDARGHEAYRGLQQHLETMWQRQREVSVALELAPLVAQESENELQLHFRPHQLIHLLRDAVDGIEAELREDRSGRQYEFYFARSCRNLGPVVCDPDFLRHVYKNVLRNALKYSKARTPGEPMLIELFGEPQSHHVGVKIRNWGVFIPDEIRDLIFEPWVRGNVEDEVKAIRGMGLGLFLARRILSAHSGSITFFSQLDRSAALRSIRRRESRGPAHAARPTGTPLQFGETVFEIRVPRTLRPGTYTHSWQRGGSDIVADRR